MGVGGRGSRVLSDADARPCEVPTVPAREAVGTVPARDGDVTEESQSWKADRRLCRLHCASQRAPGPRENPFPPAWSPSKAAGSRPSEVRVSAASEGEGRVGGLRPSARPALCRQMD